MNDKFWCFNSPNLATLLLKKKITNIYKFENAPWGGNSGLNIGLSGITVLLNICQVSITLVQNISHDRILIFSEFRQVKFLRPSNHQNRNNNNNNASWNTNLSDSVLLRQIRYNQWTNKWRFEYLHEELQPKSSQMRSYIRI